MYAAQVVAWLPTKHAVGMFCVSDPLGKPLPNACSLFTAGRRDIWAIALMSSRQSAIDGRALRA